MSSSWFKSVVRVVGHSSELINRKSKQELNEALTYMQWFTLKKLEIYDYLKLQFFYCNGEQEQSFLMHPTLSQTNETTPPPPYPQIIPLYSKNIRGNLIHLWTSIYLFNIVKQCSLLPPATLAHRPYCEGWSAVEGFSLNMIKLHMGLHIIPQSATQVLYEYTKRVEVHCICYINHHG